MPHTREFEEGRSLLGDFRENLMAYQRQSHKCLNKTYDIINEFDIYRDWFKGEEVGKHLKRNGLNNALTAKIKKLLDEYKANRNVILSVKTGTSEDC